jgi:hypothetical protein
LGLLLAAAERLWLAFLSMFDLPSVAQTDISIVGCVADATFITDVALMRGFGMVAEGGLARRLVQAKLTLSEV